MNKGFKQGFKKAAVVMLSIVMVIVLSIPFVALAESSANSPVSEDSSSAQNSPALGTTAQELSKANEEKAADEDAASTASGADAVIDEEAEFDAEVAATGAQEKQDAARNATSGTSSTITPATNCRLTVIYNEYPANLEPGTTPNEDEVNCIAERTIIRLTKGQVVSAWDYVVDIPGYFFFDAWPGQVTISTDSSQNVIELYYMRDNQFQYTVNYYVMDGANLTADNWTDALATDDVTFTKIGSEVFTDQPYGKLVEGDAYEYKLDGAYVVDSYPPQINVGTDPDNNVLNVLYASNSSRLPDKFLVPDNPQVVIPDDSTSENPDGSIGGIGGAVNPDDGSNGGTGSSGSDAASDNTGSNSSSSEAGLPNDTAFDTDQITQVLPGANGTLPDGMTQEQVNQLFADFLGTQAQDEPIEITDEMLAHPVDPAVARATIAAYKVGLEQGASSVANTDEPVQVAPMSLTQFLSIVAIIILAILSIIGFSMFFYERRKTNQALDQLDAIQNPMPQRF